MKIDKSTFVFIIYDDDIHGIVNVEIFCSKYQCYEELKQVLYSFEKCEDDEEDLTFNEMNNQLNRFQETNLQSKNYSYWLPGKHRLIHIELW